MTIENQRKIGFAASKVEVMVYCKDVEKCRNYWVEKLGFTEDGVRPGIDGTNAYAMSFGVSNVELVLQDKGLVEKYEPEINTGTPSILFYTDRIHELHDFMVGNGVKAGDVMDFGGMVTFNFCDEEEHYFAVAE